MAQVLEKYVNKIARKVWKTEFLNTLLNIN